MSEPTPTVTQQIASALSAVYAELTKYTARNGGGLVEDLVTNGKSIVGPAPDDNDYAEPVIIHHAAGNVELSGELVKVFHVETPHVIFTDLPSALTAAHDGKQFSFVGTTTTSLTLDSGIPLPEEDGSRWNATVHNESLNISGILSVTAGGIPINGALSPVLIAAMETRVITRKTDGFHIQ